MQEHSIKKTSSLDRRGKSCCGHFYRGKHFLQNCISYLIWGRIRYVVDKIYFFLLGHTGSDFKNFFDSISVSLVEFLGVQFDVSFGGHELDN